MAKLSIGVEWWRWQAGTISDLSDTPPIKFCRDFICKLRCSEYWKFANYVALLDENRWVKRILHWNAGGGRPGRSFFQWQTPIQNFCCWHRLGAWLDIAQSTDLWFQYYEDFVSFVQL